MTAELNELKQLLNSIEDSYPDFVTGILLDAKNGGITADIISYIRTHESAQTDDVIDFVCALRGWTEPLPIVDD